MTALDPAAPAISPLGLGREFNRVVLALAITATAAAMLGGFVTLAPNRLVSGQPIMLWHAAPLRDSAAIAALGLLLAALAFAPAGRWVHHAAAATAMALILLILATAGDSAGLVAADAPARARVSLGAAFWVMLAAASLALVDALQRAKAGAGVQLLVMTALAAGVVGMAETGMFDALSLAREYRNRQGVFAAAFTRHIALVVGSVGPAVLIGVPLGLVAARRPRWQGPIFIVLNLLQTIPSIALFGLLIVPLSAVAGAFPALGAMGIGGIGVAPAIVALVLYALLPVARNTAAGIAGVEPAVIDAATGMGMTRHQILWRVELPLALPVLLAGLRIVTVQAIGLAVVAALIGAGGLGSFVFEGLGQYATDLVLLGALPAIILALAADFLLQALSGLMDRRTARRMVSP